MRAVVFEGVGRFAVREVARPRIAHADDVRLRVDACGVCGTDLHIVEDPPGYPAVPGTILGHEFTGTVLEVGDAVAELRPGDRVVMEPDVYCQQCAYCARGLHNLCLNLQETGIMRHGGLAEETVAPARMLHRVPPDMPVEAAAMVEPLSCCIAAADKARILPGDNVVVLGAGPIGLLYLQVYRAAGAGRVIVVEPRPMRAERATMLGASLVLDPATGSLAARVRDATGLGADVVVDAVGSGMALGLPLLRRGGSMVIFGLNEHVREQIQQFQITVNELKIFGSLNGTHHFRQGIAFMAEGKVAVDQMVTHRMRLEQIGEAVEMLRAGQGIKVLIRPNG